VLGVHQIKELPEGPSQTSKRGGWFEVLQKQCEVTAKDGSKTTKVLALKKPKRAPANPTKIAEKISKELHIATLINDHKYTLNYYAPEDNNNTLYMDYIDSNLKDLLCQDQLTLSDTFSIAKQLIEGVSILHSSNIVHRDLKLENILVEKTGSTPSIKIIDFGDSALASDKFGGAGSLCNLGCTVPYSPIECLMDKEEGFNSFEIDYWSVVLIIYEMVFCQLPFYFNRRILNDLVEGWSREGEFCPSLTLRPRRALGLMEQVLNQLTERGLKIKQK
jgi:serine/threonine protein kinase